MINLKTRISGLLNGMQQLKIDNPPKMDKNGEESYQDGYTESLNVLKVILTEALLRIFLKDSTVQRISTENIQTTKHK